MDKYPKLEEPQGETLLQAFLACVGMIGAILVIGAMLLMIQPPEERVVYEDQKITIVERVTK